MAKISNGRIVIEVPDEKAMHYCLALGYHIVKDEVSEEAEAVSKPAPRRGRPPKKAS